MAMKNEEVKYVPENFFTEEQLKAINASMPDVTVLVAGKGRTGKSTAFNNLFGTELPTGSEADSVTTDVIVKTKQCHNVTIHCIDTPGFQAIDVDGKETLKKMDLKLSENDKRLTFLYCISVIGSGVDEADLRIVKNLHRCFGPNIWKRCVLVLTRCDLLRQDEFDKPDQDEDYVRALRTFVGKFESVFEKAKINPPPIILSLDIKEKIDPDTIIVVPVAKRRDAGTKPNILPGVEKEWYLHAFDQILRKAGNYSHVYIKLRYNLIGVVLSTASATAGTAGVGALIGVGVGSGIGAFGGPPGIAAGAITGAILGAIVGLTASASTSTIIAAVHAAQQANKPGTKMKL